MRSQNILSVFQLKGFETWYPDRTSTSYDRFYQEENDSCMNSKHSKTSSHLRRISKNIQSHYKKDGSRWKLHHSIDCSSFFIPLQPFCNDMTHHACSEVDVVFILDPICVCKYGGIAAGLRGREFIQASKRPRDEKTGELLKRYHGIGAEFHATVGPDR